MIKYAVMASGGGSDFQSAVDAQKAGQIPNGEIVALITNNPHAGAIERANKEGISAFYVAPKGSQEETDKLILKILKDYSGAEFVFLAGYLKKISPAILEQLPVYNIHPALDLKRFGGKGMHGLNVHQAVIDAGEKYSGATIHQVDEIYDHGEILMQTPNVPVLAGDTAETLQRRVLAAEHKLIPQFLDRLTQKMQEERNKAKATNFYGASGVDAVKKDVHAAIKQTDSGLYPGAFCKIKQDFDQEDWVRITHSDGVGTKLSTPYIMYRETGDPSAFRYSSFDSSAMNIDDMMCVGVTNNIAGTNSIDRESHLVKGDALTEMIGGYDDFCTMLQQHGVNIQMDSGESADVGDLVRTATMNSSWFARMPKDKLITFDKVNPGNVIIGLSSAGKATYENAENSGIRSNGLTAARRLLLHPYYQEKYPEIISPHAEKKYQGKFMLDDKLPGSDMTVAQALTSPTRTYLPIVKYILDNHPGIINGMVHCSGGGLSKSINFGKKLRYVKEDLFPIPPIFENIYETGEMDRQEMFKSFNNGHGLEIYADQQNANTIITIAKLFGVDAKIIGHIERSRDDKNHVTVKHENKEYLYTK